jgi:nitrate/nitrite transport system permease protein
MVFFLGAWQLSSQGPSIGGATKAGATAEEIEYQKMMGKDPGASKSTGFPPPLKWQKPL